MTTILQICLVLLTCGGPWCTYIPLLRHGPPLLDESIGSPAVTALNILFFGNSFSQFGNYHNLVAELADAANFDKPVVVADYVGGTDFEDHLLRVQLYPENNVQSATLPSGDTWDYVVMQGWSMFDDPGFTADALALYSAVRDHASGNGANCAGLLFQTWAYHADYTPYPPPYTDPDDMQAAIVAAYAAIKVAIDGAYSPDTATIARVGEAFQASGFTDDLYNSTDHFHPGRLGPALTAIVVYQAIYGHVFPGISYAAAEAAGFTTHFVTGIGNITLTEAEYALLQSWAAGLATALPVDVLISGPTNAVVNVPVATSATVSAPTTTIDFAQLTYGDGESLTLSGLADGVGAQYTHTYGASGTQTASVTLTDGNGALVSDSVSINVGGTLSVDAGGPATVAVSVALNISGLVGIETTTAASTLDFGDGTEAVRIVGGNIRTFTHVYGLSGAYTAEVILEDSLGTTASATATVTVAATVDIVEGGGAMILGGLTLPQPRHDDPYRKEWLPVGSNRRMINGSLRTQLVSGFWRIVPVWEGMSRAERNLLWTAYRNHLTLAGDLTLPDGETATVATAIGSWGERQWWGVSTPYYDVTFAMEEV